ncbi:MAG: hypothetical protein ACOX4I_02060 [Anaerovoracaceae bacterium]|jgi:fibronectin-binding autotransporter adhesin
MNIVSRKIRVLLLAMILAVSMTVPAAISVDKAQAAAVRVTTEDGLRQAINEASGTESDPTQIVLAANISVHDKITKDKYGRTQHGMLDIPAGKHIVLKGNTAGRQLSVSSATGEIQDSASMGMINVSGDLTIENLTVNACSKMRVVSLTGGSKLDLESGAVITGGLLGKKAQINGAGVCADNGKKSNPITINVAGGASIKGNKTSGGGNTFHVNGVGVYLGSYATMNLNGGSITGNTDTTDVNIRVASSGGGVYLGSSTSVLNMNSGSISNNLAKDDGGGIYIDDGTVNINGGSISSNTTYTHGGGIYTTGTINLKDGSISGNKVLTKADLDEISSNAYGNGGGVYIDGTDTTAIEATYDECGRMEMTGGSISGNTANCMASANRHNLDRAQGGGVYDEGEFVMTGGSITENTATSADRSSGRSGNGGGLKVCGGEYPASATVKGGTITNNSASGKGKDVLLDEGRYTDYGGWNEDTNYIQEQGNLSLEGSPVIGELYLPSGAYFMLEGYLTQDASLTINSEDRKTGSLIAEGKDYEILPSDARRMKNTDGQKVYKADDNNRIVITEPQSDKYIKLDQENTTVTVDDTPTYDGTAQKPQATVKYEGTTLTQGEDYVLAYENNTGATDNGALIRVIGAGKYDGVVEARFTIKPEDIGETTAHAIRDKLATGSAVTPAVKLYNGDTMLESGTDYTAAYENNINPGTGKVIVTGKGNYSGTRSLSFNIVSSEGKTVISSSDADAAARIQNAIDSADNAATIYIMGDVHLSAPITITGGRKITFIGADDEADILGDQLTGDDNSSMITVNDGELYTEGVKLDAHHYTADDLGCVIKIDAAGSALLGEDTIVSSGNALQGSGIYNAGDLKIEGADIVNNKKVGVNLFLSYGGGIYNAAGAALEMSGGTIENNFNISGGGIYNAGGTVSISGGTLSGNSASGDRLSGYPGNGGAIFNTRDGKVSITGGSLLQNTATESGGGIYNLGTLTVSNARIAGNGTTENGGGIYTEGSTTLGSSTAIDDNTANSSQIFRTNACGGGIYLAAGKLEMNDGEISGNTARSTYDSTTCYSTLGNGGGVFVSNDRDDPCVFTMNGGIISGNTAKGYNDINLGKLKSGHGGGVYVLGGDNDSGEYTAYPGTFEMTGGTVTGNSASSTGDGVFVSRGEEAYNNNAFSIGLNGIDFPGAANIRIGGAASITVNHGDDLLLDSDNTSSDMDAVIELTSKPTGHIGVTAEKSGDAIIAKGAQYTLSESDKDAFSNDRGERPMVFNAEDNSIMLQGLDINSDGVEFKLDNDSVVYTGEDIQPEVAVLRNGKALTEGRDYKVKYESRTADVGTYELTVSGLGEFSGEKKMEYSVVPCQLSGVVAGKLADRTYTGRAIYPTVSGLLSYGGKDLLINSDFSYSLHSNVYPGRASVVLTGMGNYTGTRTIYFNIKVKAPSRPAIRKLRSKRKGQLTVTWKAVSGASGYQVVTGRNKSCSKSRRVKYSRYRKSGVTFKKLKRRKAYYVKVRAYKTVKGRKYYGSYSKVKKIKRIR